MDWNSDAEPDLVSGERHGYFNVFIRSDTLLTGFRHYRLLDSTEIDVGMSSEPAVVDWNGDGRKDLLLSEEAGTIRFYPNLTSDTWPEFQDYALLEAGGRTIDIFRVSPYVFDLDADSVQDLVSGDAGGAVLFFRNLCTNAEPRLALPETVRTVEGKPAEATPPAMGASRCGFGDWNDDGVPDFLIGCGAGTVEVFLGVLPVGAGDSRTTELPRLDVSPSLGRPPFAFAATEPGRITIADALGRTVTRLRLSGHCGPVLWDGLSVTGAAVPPGVYLCRFAFGSNLLTTKLILTR